ncbi:hypothetical protein J3R30DRAFT_589664 [Lentinula aciculospora]|uniref:Uncharacterized protein n=1 Tax=Lentinula aciculospora TaxID=153920 RepID=A0A9W9A6R0_9AGAR|nr:hypothetical protein J3R30DRAFT_589664 [Lentinula aciculospora]
MNTSKNTKKRPRNSSPATGTHKKLKLSSISGPIAVPVAASSEPREDNSREVLSHQPEFTEQVKAKRRINKLTPARPFPLVPTSVSASGPRSAHTEGKNFICITRKTSLGAYMRRCKHIIIKDGYKILHLSAMGAAIPLLLQLSLALPPILPFAPDEIHTEIHTGTVEVQDEILPEDEEEDITYQTRGKSTLKVTLKIGDGEFSGGPTRDTKRRRQGKAREGAGGKTAGHIVYDEPEQVDAEMV